MRQALSTRKRRSALSPRFYSVALIQLPAAEMGELRLLDSATQQFRNATPQDYEKTRIQSDAVKAYALNKANQTEEKPR